MKRLFPIIFFLFLIFSYEVHASELGKEELQSVRDEVKVTKVSDAVNDQIEFNKSGLTYLYRKDAVKVINSEGITIYEGKKVLGKDIVFSQNNIFIKKGTTYIILDRKGNEIETMAYESIVSMYEKQAQINYLKTFSKGKIGVIDENGKVIIKNEWDEVTPVLLSGEKDTAKIHFIVRKGKKMGVLRENGEMFLELKYSDIHYDTVYELYWLYQGGKTGIYSEKDLYFIEPKWDQVEIVADCYLVQNKKKYGLIDRKGKIILNTIYDQIRIGTTLDEQAAPFVIYQINDITCVYDLKTHKVKYSEKTTEQARFIKIRDHIYAKYDEQALGQSDMELIVIRDGKVKKYYYTTEQWYLWYFAFEQRPDQLLIVENDRFGLIDLLGNTLLKPEWSSILFMEEYTLVTSEKDHIVRYFVYKGHDEKLFEAHLLPAEEFLDGTMIKKIGNQYSLVDFDGFKKTNYVWDEYEQISNSRYVLTTANKKAILDFESKLILEVLTKEDSKFQDTLHFIDLFIKSSAQEDALAFDEYEDAFSLQDLIEPPSTEITGALIGQTRLEIVERDGKKGVSTVDGRNVLNPVYEDIKISAQHRFIAFKTAGKWGLMMVS